MFEGRFDELCERVYKVKEKVFGVEGSFKWVERLLLKEEFFDWFLFNKFFGEKGGGRGLLNNYFSLLVMVDCWFVLGIVFYDYMICLMFFFWFWLGVVEYLFRILGLLDECLWVGIEDKSFRRDDL